MQRFPTYLITAILCLFLPSFVFAAPTDYSKYYEQVLIDTDAGTPSLSALVVNKGTLMVGSSNPFSEGGAKIWNVDPWKDLQPRLGKTYDPYGSSRKPAPQELENNRSIDSMVPFGQWFHPVGPDKIPFTMKDLTVIATDNAQVWTYDGATFTNITPADPAFATYIGVYSLAGYNNLLFIGTIDNLGTAQVWSYDGVNWTKQAIPGLSNQNSNIPCMKVYKNALYMGTVDYAEGGQVWKYDGSHWTKLSIPGFSIGNLSINTMAIYNDSLYIGTYNMNGPQVWRYNGSTWSEQTGFLKFNSSTTLAERDGAISSMAVYDGNLFIGITNNSGAASAQLWQFDGSQWAHVNIPGFSTANTGIVSMAEYNGSLFLGTNNNAGGELWYVTAAGAKNNCAATLSDDLSTLDLPIMTYAGQPFSVDLSFVPGTANLTVSNIGIPTDTDPFNSCTPATLSDDLTLQIPFFIFGGTSYWTELTYHPDTRLLTVTGFGLN